MKHSMYLTALFVFLISLGMSQFCAFADDNIFPPTPAAASAVSFDGRGFLIHGKRTFIASGGMEYDRVPRALWRDRLLRLKRAGFNCVEMYTFWNVHEPKEGQFDFSGDHDLDAYLKLVHQMGMYAICRVGPYYCAEWDGGGYPVWLRFKGDVHVRTDDPKFLAAMDPFFDKLLPIVAANQINHGGSVILVQLENEHLAGGGSEVPNAYFKHLQAKALALGIQVPYFFSGLHHGGDPAGDHSWDSASRKSPWMTTEFWSVNFDRYGAGAADADTYERRTWKILAFGGNGYNDYMAHGGTNFGYTNNDEDAASYDYGSAVGQAGDLRPTYYRYKRLNFFAFSFPEIMEDSINADAAFAGAATNTAVRVTARKSPGGTAVFLDNPGPDVVKTQVKGQDGQVFPLSGPMTLLPGQIMPVVEGAALTPHITLTLGATRILGMATQDKTAVQDKTTTLVVYGLPGDPGQLRLAAPAGAKTTGLAGAWARTPDGYYDLTLSYPANRPAEYTLTAEGETVRILSMSDTLADHTWFIPAGAGTDIVCGPSYVGDVTDTGDHLRLTTERGLDAPPGISPDPYAEASPGLVYGPSADGAPLIPLPVGPVSVTIPKLSGWESQPVTEAAPHYSDAKWLVTADPKPMGLDGDASAYAWYRTTVHASAAGDYALAFSSANDRIITLLDGVRLPDHGLHRSVVNLPLTAGDHTVAILAIHYGRAKLFGYTGPFDTIDVKGLAGPARLGVSAGPGTAITDWRVLMTPNADRASPPDPSASGWAPVEIGGDPFHGSKGNAWFQATLPAGLLKSGMARQVLHFESVDDNGTVFLNGKQVVRHEGWNEAFDAPVEAALAGGQPVVLSVLVQNLDGAGGIDKPVTLLSYRSDDPVTRWKMRGGIAAGLSETAWMPLPAGTTLNGSPRFFRTRFTPAPPAQSGLHPILRVVTGSLSAGFVWLNGHNLGRYPEKIPVNGLYLPECWLQPGENTLIIFDEDGKRPDGVTLTVETVASRIVTAAELL